MSLQGTIAGIAWIALLSTTLAPRCKADYPCLNFPLEDIEDEWSSSSNRFMKQNLVTLYQDSDSYYSYGGDSLRDCNLKFIDLYTISAPAHQEDLWISLMGDSLMRELFHGTIQRFAGTYVAQIITLEHLSAADS